MHFTVNKVKSVHGFIGVKTQGLVILSFHRSTPFRVVFSIVKLCVDKPPVFSSLTLLF